MIFSDIEGHLDFKPFLSGKSSNQGEIHLNISIGEADFVWLYGELKHTIIYLDLHGAENITRNSVYVPRESRRKWSNVKQHGDISLHVNGLPRGMHVMSIQKATLTHVITWP